MFSQLLKTTLVHYSISSVFPTMSLLLDVVSRTPSFYSGFSASSSVLRLIPPAAVSSESGPSVPVGSPSQAYSV